MGSDEHRLWHLNSAFGSSHIASSAYQKWHTSNPAFCVRLQIEQVRLLTYLKFKNRLRKFLPQYLQSFALPASGYSYPEGNFGGNQLLDGLISLLPLHPILTIELHVRITMGLHQSFLWLHPIQASFGSQQVHSHLNPAALRAVGMGSVDNVPSRWGQLSPQHGDRAFNLIAPSGLLAKGLRTCCTPLSVF